MLLSVKRVFEVLTWQIHLLAGHMNATLTRHAPLTLGTTHLLNILAHVKLYCIAKKSLYRITHNSGIIPLVKNWMSTLPFGIVFSYKRRLTFSFTITAGGVVVPLELIV